MSAGCVHQKASLMLAGGLLLSGGSLDHIVGALIGVLLTPDLDVDNGYIGDSIIRRIGFWADKGWDMLWYFYRRSIKHGSELSHFPVISTMFRLAYLFFFVLVIPYSLLELVIPSAFDIRHELQWWLNWLARHNQMILSLMGSDLIHWALDILTSESKGRKAAVLFGVPIASSSCK